MDTSIILLDIPQGVVTFGSAVLVALIAFIATLAVVLFRFAISVHGRLKALETVATNLVGASAPSRLATGEARMEILWEQYLYEGIPNLRRRVGPPGNPMLQERWDELITKLERHELPDVEAEELLAAFLERREQAREEDDVVTMLLLGPGIVLTKWQLKERELRESK